MMDTTGLPTPATKQVFSDDSYAIVYLDTQGVAGTQFAIGYDTMMNRLINFKRKHYSILWVGRVTEQHWPPPATYKEMDQRTAPA